MPNSLLQDFANLPEEIEDPHEAISWKEYQTFLEKYGSHMIKKVKHGSSIRYFTFAKSSHAYTQREFQIGACLGFAGYVDFALINISTCSSIKHNEIVDRKAMKTTGKLTILGGSYEARSRLSLELPTNIVRFLESAANSSDQAIGNEFLPIWRILSFPGLNERVVENLKAYLDFDCRYRRYSRKGGNGVVLQEFVKSGSSIRNINRYVCRIPPLGCQENADCHRMLSGCSCYGSSCVTWTLEDRIPFTEDVYRGDIREFKDKDVDPYDPPSKHHRILKCTCEQTKSYHVQWDSANALVRQEQKEVTPVQQNWGLGGFLNAIRRLCSV